MRKEINKRLQDLKLAAADLDAEVNAARIEMKLRQEKNDKRNRTVTQNGN